MAGLNGKGPNNWGAGIGMGRGVCGSSQGKHGNRHVERGGLVGRRAGRGRRGGCRGTHYLQCVTLSDSEKLEMLKNEENILEARLEAIKAQKEEFIKTEEKS